jgi:hypothetical protein
VWSNVPFVTHHPPAAEGWYRDPYGIHQDRWFSAGNPTALVRDQGVEGHDAPPGDPPPGPPVEIPEVDKFPSDDLRRADEAEAGGVRYDAERVSEQASDAAATSFGGYGLW